MNLRALQLYFAKIISQDTKDKEGIDAYISLDNSRMIPRFLFDDYYY